MGASWIALWVMVIWQRDSYHRCKRFIGHKAEHRPPSVRMTIDATLLGAYQRSQRCPVLDSVSLWRLKLESWFQEPTDAVTGVIDMLEASSCLRTPSPSFVVVHSQAWCVAVQHCIGADGVRNRLGLHVPKRRRRRFMVRVVPPFNLKLFCFIPMTSIIRLHFAGGRGRSTDRFSAPEARPGHLQTPVVSIPLSPGLSLMRSPLTWVVARSDTPIL